MPVRGAIEGSKPHYYGAKHYHCVLGVFLGAGKYTTAIDCNGNYGNTPQQSVSSMHDSIMTLLEFGCPLRTVRNGRHVETSEHILIMNLKSSVNLLSEFLAQANAYTTNSTIQGQTTEKSC